MTLPKLVSRLTIYLYIALTIALSLLASPVTIAEAPHQAIENKIQTETAQKETVESITPTAEKYTVLAQAKHNESSFTQGLSLKSGIFYESSGLYNKSYLHKYAQDSSKDGSKNDLRIPLNNKIFAEGLEVVGDQLYLLTWRAGLLMIFNKNTLKHENTIKYEGEGWGLAHDGKYFYMSNGSNEVNIRKQDFQTQRTIRIHDNERNYSQINELEYANGFLWANVWQSNLILKIQPFSGLVVTSYDLSALTKANSKKPGHSVLNGIAYDEAADAMWITGKLWPNRYLVKFQ